MLRRAIRVHRVLGLVAALVAGSALIGGASAGDGLGEGGLAVAAAGGPALSSALEVQQAPSVVDTRTIDLVQTVSLSGISHDAKKIRMWVPIPSDGAWQRVLDLSVPSAPAGWRLVRQAEGRGDFVYVEAPAPKTGTLSVVVRCRVQRDGVVAPLDAAASTIDPALFRESLDREAPLMAVDERIQTMADSACGAERDAARQARLLMAAVAQVADHYSKDASKPTCGRGAAQDCLDHGGGCCTDLHSLFIALARARGIPARMQYGYRVLDAKVDTLYDPGYRCWIEVFVPGAGWVPTDVVAADGAASAEKPPQFGTLSATRVWLWSGRSFELTPPAQQGRIDTMICGWAEIDGTPVDPLPDAKGMPSKLSRTIRFTVLERTRAATAPAIPE